MWHKCVIPVICIIYRQNKCWWLLRKCNSILPSDEYLNIFQFYCSNSNILLSSSSFTGKLRFNFRFSSHHIAHHVTILIKYREHTREWVHQFLIEKSTHRQQTRYHFIPNMKDNRCTKRMTHFMHFIALIYVYTTQYCSCSKQASKWKLAEDDTP